MSSTAREQRQQRRRAAHVTARLDPLDDDQVAPGVDGASRLLHGSHLPAGQRPTGVHLLNRAWVGIAVEELDQPGA